MITTGGTNPERRIPGLLRAFILALMAAAFALHLADVRGMSAEAPNLPILTRIDQIRALGPDQAKLGHPVRLCAVVTYYGGSGWELFVQDSTAGIYVDATKQAWPVKAGDLIELAGTVAPGDFAPVVTNAQIKILGLAPLPSAARLTLDELRTGKADGQWVQLEGVLRSVVELDGHGILEIGLKEGRLPAEIPFLAEHLARLVDSRIRFKGVCGTIFNKKRQLIGIHLFIPSLDQVSVLQPAPLDPFAIPVRPIDTLLRFAPDGISDHRVRVHGQVTYQLLGTSLFIADNSEGLYLKTSQRTQLKLGDLVDVVGFPTIGSYDPILEHAIFRRLGSGQQLAPARITATEALHGDHDANLVQIEGQLEDQTKRVGEDVMILLANDIMFEAKIIEGPDKKSLPALPDHSRVSLTGVCSVETNEGRVPIAFRILLRSPDDVRLISMPPWWTVGKALASLGILSGIFLVAAGWVIVLRGRVHAQTEIIRQRLELESSLEKRFQYIAQATNDVIRDWDLASDSIWCSESIQTLFGYSAEEVDPTPSWWRARIHPEDHDRVTSGVREMIDGGGDRWSDDYRFRRANGSYAHVLDRYCIMRDDQGKAVRMIGVMMDVSAQKLVEEQLHRAKEAAESANKAKSAFLANMSHEIRTPMNGILGTTELILDMQITPEQREYLNMIKASADALMTIINDILDFSKIEAGKLELEGVEFDLRRSLEGITKSFALQAHQKGLELICDVHPDIPDMVIGDPTRLRQILVNLLGNAIKFTEHGEVVLKVESISKEGERIQLHFGVRDTGIGIPANKQNTIFKAFAQADGSTTRKYGGTGLGLTISARLVELMKGQIWVESEVGCGSQFHFTADFGSGGSTPQPREATQASLERVPVLIVDDNATNRRILQDALSSWGMHTTVAESGEAALALLQKSNASENGFSLILTDANMPGLDGFGLAEKIKFDLKNQGPTIMMLTSSGQRGDAARCRALGVAAYLTKPILHLELRDAILKVLGQSHETKETDKLITMHSLAEEKWALNILLAEDNRVNQLLVTKMLMKKDHRLTVVNNGLECLKAMELHNFDLILMDVQMPEMDGFETTEKIRDMEKESGKHVTIFALTAHAMTGDRDRCLKAGMDDYLTKPVRLQELLGAIERHFPAISQSQRQPVVCPCPEADSRGNPDRVFKER